MAPPSVFSYFRNHRRSGSSPIVSQSSTFQSSQPGHPPPASPARSEFATTSTSSQYGRLETSSPQPPAFAASSPIPSQPPVLPPIQRVASVIEKRGTTKRPPRAARSTTSPVLSTPKRWAFEDVPESTEEEEESAGLGLSGLGTRGLDLETIKKPVFELSEGAGDSEVASSAEAPLAREQERPPPQEVLEARASANGFTVDFDDGFKLNSLDLDSRVEDSPVSPTDPAPPSIQPAKRSRSPQKHWALPPLTITTGKDSSSSKRPISDDVGSSGSSIASTVNRSYSSVTLNPPDVSNNTTGLVQLSPVTTLKPVRQRKSILNPMSLLHRRRTSQGVDDDELLSLGGTVIRGKGVHDFDKPRTRRNLSTNDLDGFRGHSMGDVSPVEEYKRRADMPWSIPENDAARVVERARKQSTPVFTERFDEEEEDAETAVRRETLANPAFLARAQEHIESNSHSPSPPPPVEQRQKQERIVPQAPIEESRDAPHLPSINIIQGTPNLAEGHTQFPNYEPAEHAPLQAPTDSEQLPLQSAGLEHLEQSQPEQLQQPEWTLATPTPRLKSPSNASEISRWSFVPGDSSAQEELVLEQRHMEKVAQEQAERTGNIPAEERQEEDDDEVSDYGTEGSFYEDDEEPVPEIGADDEEEHVRRDINLPSSNKLPSQPFPAPPGHDFGTPTTSMHAGQPGSDVESSTQATATSLQSHVSPMIARQSPTISFPAQPQMPEQHGLGLIIPQQGGHQFAPYMQEGYTNDQVHQPSPDNDDMYFNDGDIEEPSPLEEGHFDESVFDRDLKPGQPLNNQHLDLPDSALAEDGDVTPVRKSVRIQEQDDRPMSNSSLHAYHSALASAAAKAEASGKFEHDAMSPLTRHDPDVSDEEDGLPQHNFYQQQSYELPQGQAQMYYSQQYQEEQPYWQTNDYDDFDPSDLAFDSEDIAAANAEALAADDSGFYGREFNFYSRGANGSEEYSGGFFGTPGKDASIQRQKSLREPILTPITERSEFSRAPSFMSMGSPLFGPASFTNQYAPQGSSPGLPSIPFRSADGQLLHPSSPAMPSPGLKELASRMGMNHDDMTLTQLRKLRQQALGGAGFSPVTAHFSPSSPAAGGTGVHHFGPMLSPNTAAFPTHGPMPSSPLVSRSANIPSQSSSPGPSSHDVKVGEVPDRAKRRSMMASTTTSDVPSSPPSVEVGRNAPPTIEDPRDYFSPDSPSSPFTASITGLGLDMSSFHSPRIQSAIDEDEHDAENADALEGADEDEDEDIAVDSPHYDSDDLLDPDTSGVHIAPPPRTPHAPPTQPFASLHSNPVSAADLLPLPLPRHLLPTASEEVYESASDVSKSASLGAEGDVEDVTPMAAANGKSMEDVHAFGTAHEN